MKIILIHDVQQLGKSDEIHDVASGYARNFLLPKGLAIPWSFAAVNEIKVREEKGLKTMQEIASNADAYAEKLNKITLKFSAKTSDKDTLFGSITEDDIVQKIEDEGNMAIAKKNILLEDHIKKTGEYTVPVRLSDSVVVDLKIVVSGTTKKKATKKK